MTQHPRSGMPDTGDLAQAEAMPSVLRRVAVMAPDDAPGLHALRERLGGWMELSAEHHPASFRLPHSVALPAVFDRILERHGRQPYDAILLLDGRADALGIAESTRLIPEQIRRMPVPVWSAIAEDDANTEIGDVAARTFASPAALFEALQRCLHAAPAPAGPATTVEWLPVPAVAPAMASAPARARTHPLVLCAAGAVILASVTAIAAMLGLLPDLGSRAAAPGVVTSAPASAATSAPRLLPSADMALAASPSALPDGAKGSNGPAAASPSTPVTVLAAPAAPANVGARAGDAVLQPAALAEPSSQPPAAAPPADPGAPAALPASSAEPERPKAAAAGPPRSGSHVAHRTVKHKRTLVAQAETPRYRSPGSEEVPEFNFVGTKTRSQVVAELLAARRRDEPNANPDIPASPQTRARGKH